MEKGQGLSSQHQRVGPWASGCCTESPDSPSSLHLNMHELISPSPKRPLRAAALCLRRPRASGGVVRLGAGPGGEQPCPRVRGTHGVPQQCCPSPWGCGLFKPQEEGCWIREPLVLHWAPAWPLAKQLSRLWFLCLHSSRGGLCQEV